MKRIHLILFSLLPVSLIAQKTYVIGDFDLPYFEELRGIKTDTWTPNNTYILHGTVFVNPDEVLTIEPGTVIKGRYRPEADSVSQLVISKGAKIMADGTPAEPIIFSSEGDFSDSYLSNCQSPLVDYISDREDRFLPGSHNGWGPIELNQSNGERGEEDGNKISMNGIYYPKGIGMHSSDPNHENIQDRDTLPQSILRFDLNGEYTVFKSDVGPQDNKLKERDGEGPISKLSIQFIVLVDGEERYRSDVMTPGSRVEYVEVDVRRANTLELVLDNGGSGVDGNFKRSDHGNWGNARLERCAGPGTSLPQNIDPSPSDRSLWGGLVILGDAPVNASASIDLGSKAYGRDEYGGNDRDDDSGILNYVSIRHGGGVQDRKVNGLTLAGVGSETDIDFVEVFSCYDDGIEICGGTVNAKHMAMAFNGADGFDMDLGYEGRGQYWFSIQNNQVIQIQNGQFDGAAHNGRNNFTSPTLPRIYNSTFIGTNEAPQNNDRNYALLFGNVAAGMYKNNIFVEFNQGVKIQQRTGGNNDSYDLFLNGDLTLENNIFWDIRAGSEGSQIFRLNNQTALTEAQNFAASFEGRDNIYNSPEFNALNSRSRIAGARSLDPRPRLDLQGFADQDLATPPNDQFFDSPDFKGAFGPTLWIENWTALDAYGYLGTTTAGHDAPLLPDLEITNVEGLEQRIDPGSDMTVNVTISNTGQFDANAVQTQIRLASGDISPINLTSIAQIPKGQSASLEITIPLAALPEGNQELIFEVDPGKDIREEDEGNNIFRHTFVIGNEVIPAPDLALSKLKASPSIICLDEPFTVEFFVKNIGDAVAGNIGLTLTLDGETLDPEPASLVGSLGIGDSAEYQLNVNFLEGTTIGVKSLELTLILADDKSTVNNKDDIPITAQECIDPGPDIKILGLRAAPAMPEVGTTVNLNFDIANIGEQTADLITFTADMEGTELTIDPSSYPSGIPAGDTVSIEIVAELPEAVLGEKTVTLTLTLEGEENTGNNADFEVITIIERLGFSISPSFLASHTHGVGGNTEQTITVSDPLEVSTVEFFHRPISAPDAEFSSDLSVIQDGSSYKVSIEDAQTGPIGVNYYFRVTTNSGEVYDSEAGYTYLRYNSPGLSVITTQADTMEKGYKIISVPLELDQNSFNTVFRNSLGDNSGKTQWRFMHFDGSTSRDYTGAIEPGKGYWILTRNPVSLQTGSGVTVNNNELNPFTIDLTGVNTQIGNPYNFTILWSDIVEANNLPSGVDLKTWDGGWIRESQLDAFEGAFVQNTAGISSLTIPVKRNPNVNRLAAKPTYPPLDSTAWFVPINLKSGGLIHEVSGIGMHPEANENLDVRDMMGLPRFNQFLDMNFPVESNSSTVINENYVDTRSSYSWEMEVISNLGKPITINWDPSQFGVNSQQLWLEELETGIVIDMRQEDAYTFHSSSETSRFFIHFGELSYVASQAPRFSTRILEPYPNPFKDRLLIPLYLPPISTPTEVHMELFNHLGQKISETHWGKDMRKSFQLLKWNLDRSAFAEGLYFYRIEIEGEDFSTEKSGKLYWK